MPCGLRLVRRLALSSIYGLGVSAFWVLDLGLWLVFGFRVFGYGLNLCGTNSAKQCGSIVQPWTALDQLQYVGIKVHKTVISTAMSPMRSRIGFSTNFKLDLEEV
jgi:hypothetical protein